MNTDLLITLVLLFSCIIMFAVNRPRMDVVALLVIAILPLSGVISVPEALDGFSDSNVVLIALLFVIGEGLVRTGIAAKLGDVLVKTSQSSETKVVIFLMGAVAGLGAFVSSTGIVAIFIPVVIRIASQLKISSGRLMMPLCFSGLISGMMTLVATPPNMVLDGALKRNGFSGFGFFSITPIGIVVLILGIVYMLAIRKSISRDDESSRNSGSSDRRTLQTLIDDYQLADQGHCLRIRPGSLLVGKTLRQFSLRSQLQANVVAIQRHSLWSHRLIRPKADQPLCVHDLLLTDVAVHKPEWSKLLRTFGLDEVKLKGAYFLDQAQEVGMAEVLIAPQSELIGKSIKDLDFRKRFRVSVVGIRRGGTAMKEDFVSTPLKLGDTLLVVGPWKTIGRLRDQQRGFVVLNLPSEFASAAPALRHAPFALLSLAVMVGLMVSGLVPNVQAALIACLTMGAFGCITMTSAYQSIHWQSLVVIVGMMPFALALQRTGGIDLAVSWFLKFLGGADLRVVLACLFALTSLTGLFISNTATAVLMAPISLEIARQTGMPPHPYAMTVALAASSAFMAPISSPVNMLVMGPGKYRFSDFVKVGVPFTLLVMAITVIMVPWLFRASM